MIAEIFKEGTLVVFLLFSQSFEKYEHLKSARDCSLRALESWKKGDSWKNLGRV